MTILPKTLTGLKALPTEKLQEIWSKYFFNINYSKKPIIKTLWYHIQCINNDIYIENHHQTKLNRYSKDPEMHIKKAIKNKIILKAGTEIRRNYKGKEYIVIVKKSGTFIYNDKEYNSLSAVAIAICGKKVSGNHFFGLHNKKMGEINVKD